MTCDSEYDCARGSLTCARPDCRFEAIAPGGSRREDATWPVNLPRRARGRVRLPLSRLMIRRQLGWDVSAVWTRLCLFPWVSSCRPAVPRTPGTRGPLLSSPDRLREPVESPQPRRGSSVRDRRNRSSRCPGDAVRTPHRRRSLARPFRPFLTQPALGRLPSGEELRGIIGGPDPQLLSPQQPFRFRCGSVPAHGTRTITLARSMTVDLSGDEFSLAGDTAARDAFHLGLLLQRHLVSQETVELAWPHDFDQAAPCRTPQLRSWRRGKKGRRGADPGGLPPPDSVDGLQC